MIELIRLSRCLRPRYFWQPLPNGNLALLGGRHPQQFSSPSEGEAVEPYLLRFLEPNAWLSPLAPRVEVPLLRSLLSRFKFPAKPRSRKSGNYPLQLRSERSSLAIAYRDKTLTLPYGNWVRETTTIDGSALKALVGALHRDRFATIRLAPYRNRLYLLSSRSRDRLESRDFKAILENPYL